MKHALAILPALLACAPPPAMANEDHEPMARALVAEALYGDLHRSMVLETISAQNETPIDTSAASILELERQWSRDRLEGGGTLLSSVDQSALSTYLRTLKAESDGLYTEILVTDALGFLVGQSDVATDYYQGDERKYLMTYPVGPGTVFVDLVEYDASVQRIQSQVSFTIVDPDNGESIGVATVGIDGDRL